MDRCIGGRGEFEKFYFPVKSDHFLPYSRYSALARGLVKEAPLGCRSWRDFPFSCQTRSFPATSAAFGIGERVGSGGASVVSGLARFPIFLPNPVISCHICRILRWREDWFGRRLWGFRGWRDFPFSCQTGHFLPHPASSGGFRRFRVKTVLGPGPATTLLATLWEHARYFGCTHLPDSLADKNEPTYFVLSFYILLSILKGIAGIDKREDASGMRTEPGSPHFSHSQTGASWWGRLVRRCLRPV